MSICSASSDAKQSYSSGTDLFIWREALKQNVGLASICFLFLIFFSNPVSWKPFCFAAIESYVSIFIFGIVENCSLQVNIDNFKWLTWKVNGNCVEIQAVLNLQTFPATIL